MYTLTILILRHQMLLMKGWNAKKAIPKVMTHLKKSVYNWAFHFHTYTEVEPSALARYSAHLSL